MMIKIDKGTIFRNIPQGLDENCNPIYVDRPLLDDLIITDEDIREVWKECPNMEGFEVPLYLAQKRGIIDLQGVKKR
jgi:hypothetical protein